MWYTFIKGRSDMRKEEKTQEKLEKLENAIGKFDSQKPKAEKRRKLPTFFTSEVLALLVITMLVSLLMGGIITYKFFINNSEFVDKELQEFINNYEYIIDNYFKQGFISLKNSPTGQVWLTKNRIYYINNFDETMQTGFLTMDINFNPQVIRNFQKAFFQLILFGHWRPNLCPQS